jgi:hypothetical protein
MPNKITVTGSIGPGNTLTAQVFNNVTDLDFDLAEQDLKIVSDGGKTTHVDLYTIATVTYTIAAHVATVTIST